MSGAVSIQLSETSRGFLRGEFVDLTGLRCSIQESSSSVAGGALWLGADHGCHEVDDLGVRIAPETVARMDRVCSARMELSREQARQLVGLLQRFVERGNLREPGSFLT